MSELDKLISELGGNRPKHSRGRQKGEGGNRERGSWLFPGIWTGGAGRCRRSAACISMGDDREIEKARRYYPAFFCAPVQQMLEQAMGGEYDGC